MTDKRNYGSKSLLPRLLLIAIVPLAGCQSLSQEELTWQTLHAMDVAQTMNAADDPCYVEDAWLTSQIIGSQPSKSEVLLWGIGTAVAHAWISNALESSEAPRWVQKTWSFATIAHTGYTVLSNHDEGVRMFGDNKPVDGCFP